MIFFRSSSSLLPPSWLNSGNLLDDGTEDDEEEHAEGRESKGSRIINLLNPLYVFAVHKPRTNQDFQQTKMKYEL